MKYVNRNKIIILVMIICFFVLSMKSAEYIKFLCRNDHSLVPDKNVSLDIDSLTEFSAVENADIDSVQIIDMLSSFSKDSIPLCLHSEEERNNL